MTAPLVLALYALVASTAGAALLRRAAWPDRSPRLGIVAWQTLSASVLLAMAFTGMALALPTLPITTDVADLLQACAVALREQYETPGGAFVATAGAVVAVTVVARTVYSLVAGWHIARCHRRTQRRGLALVARRDTRSGALIIDHSTPAVYCMPGRRSEVVLSSAAEATLDTGQLHAVLAHERAHLRARHDLILMVAGALHAAFPFVPVFRTARLELGRLVEMDADDRALTVSDRRDLATALVSLAEGPAPAGTLGAGGTSALARVRRLAEPKAPLGILRSIGVLGVALGAVVFPVLVVAAPGMAAAALDYCPVGFPA